MTQRYFHVTTKDRLKSIRTKGIETGHRRRWNNPFGAKLGRTTHVYLISDFHDAVRWAGKMQWDLGPGQNKPKPDIFIVCLANVPGEIEPDTNAGFFANFYQIAGSVPARCIDNVVEFTDALVKQLVACNRTGERIAEPALTVS